MSAGVRYVALPLKARNILLKLAWEVVGQIASRLPDASARGPLEQWHDRGGKEPLPGVTKIETKN